MQEFREDHRLYQARWFQLFPALAYAEIAILLLTGHAGGFARAPWFSLLGPVLFFLTFASSGYRTVVTREGLKVHGLGLFALHESAVPFVWRWCDVAAQGCRAAEARESWGVFKWFGFPAFTLGRRSGMAISLGTPRFVRLHRSNGRPVSVGTCRPDELVAALRQVDG
jgi:hypothetical protein